MSVGRFLILAAVLHGLFGLVAFAAPSAMAGLFGVVVDAGGAAVVRLLGATLIGIAAVFWWSRDLVAAHMIQGVLVGGGLVNFLSLLIVVVALGGDVMAARAWVGAVVRLLLALGFAWFAFVRPPKLPA